jgi:hypothetical protein
MTDLRHRCRNPRCRMKLPAPVENEHHAFCTRGCFDQFYRARCLVCESPLRNDRRTYCPKPNRCGAEARKWPRKYLYPQNRKLASKSAHSAGLKTGLAAIRAPRYVLDVEVWAGDWQPAVSSGGVPIEIRKLRPRALRGES